MRPTFAQESLKLKARAVEWGSQDVSSSPLCSDGYVSCRAVALFNGALNGLAHIYPYDSPQKYLDKMLSHFGHDTSSIGAAVVEADRKYGMDLRVVLPRDYGIPVQAYFAGAWDESGNSRIVYPRDVLTIPSSREVIIFIRGERKVLKVD